MEGYRKELKYIVSEAVLLDVENRIRTIMPRDINQKGDFYRIRSIYLDSPTLACLDENEAGVSTREKYRIRIYDCSDQKVSAEIKIRHRETISKMSADISLETVNAVMNSDRVLAAHLFCKERDAFLEKIQNDSDFASRYTDRDIEIKRKTLESYAVKLSGDCYQPAVMVDYERCAYVYAVGNVRITFDRNVNASREFGRFFDGSLQGRCAIENGFHVLEIKYDEFLPDEILSVLSGVNLERTNCSKYAKCMYTYM